MPAKSNEQQMLSLSFVPATVDTAVYEEPIELGVDRFVTPYPVMRCGQDVKPMRPTEGLLEEIELADRLGFCVFGIGEHHAQEFLDSSPAILLGAAAVRTQHIRLTSAVTVLSAADPVRVFEDFATVDQLSNGRAEIIAGRGSSVEAFSLFGLDVQQYDELYAEKLDLLLTLRANARVNWAGKYRPRLTGQGVYPRPVQKSMPVWVGATGTAESFVRAGTLGLPLALGVIGGEYAMLRPHVDLYREAGRRAGRSPNELVVGVHAIGYVADTAAQARDQFFPPYAEVFTAIGQRVGWPAVTRSRFNALCSSREALVVGGPDEVANKIAHIDHVLGGISRISLQMSVGPLPHERRLRTIELLGTEVAGRLRQREGSVTP